MQSTFRILLAFICVATACAEELTVVSYNVWNGFNEKTAIDKGVAWIQAQDPDILALQELVEIDATELADLAKGWGHEHSAIVKEDGYPVGITSKTPIEVVERRLRGMHHGFLHARTAGYDFFVIHLAPGANRLRKRKQEVEILTEVLTPAIAADKRLIVLGDFNDVSPFDIDDDTRDVEVIRGFLDLGLIDTAYNHAQAADHRPSGTYPTRTFKPEVSQEDHEPNTRRIDYVFVSKNVIEEVTSAKSPRHPDLDIISDHYPIVIRLDQEP